MANSPSNTKEKDSQDVPIGTNSNKNTKIQTIKPKILAQNNESIILGTVISHETATIFPRREGIVKDIYFDIGDTVQEGQVVASLLPRGVEGESEALISEKLARKKQAQTDLQFTEKVATEAIANARQTIIEMEQALKNSQENENIIVKTALSVAENVQEEEIKKVELAKQKIQVSQANIETVKEAIQRAQIDRNTKIENAHSAIYQSVEQAEIATIHMRQSIEQVLMGDIRDGNRSSLNELYDKDLDFELGAQKPQTRIDLIKSFNELQDYEQKFIVLPADEKKGQIAAFINKGLETALLMKDLLNGTITHMKFSQSDLTKSINTIHAAQSNLLNAKEKSEKSLLGLKILQSTEAEYITGLEQKLQELEQILKATQKDLEVSIAQKNKNSTNKYDELQTIKTVQSNGVSLLEEKLKSAQQNLNFVTSDQQRNIAKAQEMLSISSSVLGAEITKSAHHEIRSPFTGIISKRFIEVGQIVSPMKSSFELIGVDTTLSKKAKAEIKFGIPEGLRGEITLGMNIEFFPLDSELESYSAVISRISPQVDSESHTITVQAEISNEHTLPHHASVRIKLSATDQPLYSIPSQSIKRIDSKNYIWLLVEGDQQKLEVQVVSEDGEYTEVRGAINENVEVIVKPDDV